MEQFTEQEKILIIDDDKDILLAYKALLKQQKIAAHICDNPLIAAQMIPVDWCGVIIIDIYMPYLSGIELMEKIHHIDKHIPILLITGHGDVPLAVESVKKGAYDFLEKPINPAQFIEKINTALTERSTYLAQKLQKQEDIMAHLIGESVWIKEMREKILNHSLTSLPVYLYGPPGSGKLLAAQQILPNNKNIIVERHNLKQVESYEEFELWIRRANDGILIIQHIDLLPIQYQKILVRFQTQAERKFKLIVTSYKKPEQLAAEGILLPELYYLFSLTKLEFLGLEHRKKDIVLIFEYYLKIACKKLSIKRPIITEILRKTLTNRSWENNVSELISAAELFAVGIMPTRNSESVFYVDKNASLEQHIDEYEKSLIIKALDMYHGKINEAADYLQIPRKKLYLRIKKHQLDKNRFKS